MLEAYHKHAHSYMPYRYTPEQLQYKQSGYTRLFPYCAPIRALNVQTGTHTHPPEHIQMHEKKQLSAVGATEQYIHINSQTTKPLFSLYLIDIVFLLPFSRSISLSCVCYCFWGWFCSDHHSLQVRFRWYYVNISGWHTYIYWAPPSSFYNALQTNKKKIGEMLGCFENISSHQRTNNNKKNCWTTPKKSIHIHTFNRPK